MGAVEEIMCVVYVSVTKGHSADGCDFPSTLCTYDLRMGDLFVLRLGKGATSEAGKYLFRATNVWWRCAQYVVCVCKGSDRCCVSCLYWEILAFRRADVVCLSCEYPVAVLNAAFCMTCSLLMLVEDARSDHMKEAYSRACLMTAL